MITAKQASNITREAKDKYKILHAAKLEEDRKLVYELIQVAAVRGENSLQIPSHLAHEDLIEELKTWGGYSVSESMNPAHLGDYFVHWK